MASSARLSFARRIGLVTFACIQNSLVGGIVFGWASVASTLLAAKKDHGGADLSLIETTEIFSWACTVSMVSSLILGVALDHYGPRYTSIVSNIIISFGCQTFACSHHFWGFAIGTCLIAFGGPGIQSSVVHISNLFPRNQYLAMSCLTGSISLSFSVLAFFDILWTTSGLGYRTLFGAYTLVVVGSAISSFLFLPDKAFEQQVDDEEVTEPFLEIEEPTPEHDFVEATAVHLHLVEQPLDSFLRSTDTPGYHRSRSFITSKMALDSGDDRALKAMSLKDKPFSKQLFSATYFRSLLTFIATSFCASFFVASISIELSDSDNNIDNDTRHPLTRILTFAMALGIFASIIAGRLMDMIGIEWCTFATLVLGQVHFLILIFGSQNRFMMIVGFCVYSLFRQFLFPVFIASLTARLGFKYFGMLCGIGFTISGVVQLLMPYLVRLVQGTCHLHAFDECSQGAWKSLHVMQFVILGLLIFMPFLDHNEKVKQEQEIRSILGSPTYSSYSDWNYGSTRPIETFGSKSEADE